MLTDENLSIIIPFHKNIEMLKLSLATLQKTIKIEPEIIIIANNADLKEIDLNLGREYNVIKIAGNLFWPKAVNLGVSLSRKDFIAICDPDLFYWDNWLSELSKCLINNENVGVVSSKLINPLNNRIIDFGMAYNTFNVLHTTRGLLYNHPITMCDRPVQAACGATFLMRRKSFLDVNGIDESMPYIYCDNDFSLKLAKKGLSTWVVANSNVYHKGNTDKNNSKYYSFSYLREDSKAAFYAKNIAERKIDTNSWLKYFWEWYLKNTNLVQKNYILLDFCTLLDIDLYYNIFKYELNLNILDIYKFSVEQRNIYGLQLYNYVKTSMIDINIPFIYFVDNFVSLINNKIWFKLRDISRDLVIDQHGNIINFCDIANSKV